MNAPDPICELATMQRGRPQEDAPIGASSQEPAVELLKVCLPAKPLTEAALCDWIAQALPGERLQYHQGLLLVDRSEATSPFPSRERQRIHAVAKRAWNACELGLVHLVSQRIGPFVFGYFAVRARMTPDAAQVRKQLLATAH